jgi:glucokinase
VSRRTFGVDVGGTKILTLCVDESGRVLDESRVATPKGLDDTTPGASTADAIAEAVAAMAQRQGVELSDSAIGVGLPGMMTREGRLAFAPNVPTASGADLGQLLRERLDGVAVRCENDADCAAVAEHRWGAAKGCDDVIMVTLGTGIGERDHQRRSTGSGPQRLRRRDRPYGHRRPRTSVPVRFTRVLGAFRVRRRRGSTGS